MKKSIAIVLLFFSSLVVGFSQISQGGQPISSITNIQEVVVTQVIPLAEKDNVVNDDLFTTPVQVDIDINTHGEWTELSDGGRIWRIKLVTAGKGLAAFYDEFYLPRGSELFMYSTDKKQVLGAYTAKNNRDTELFMTGIIEGQEAIVEYYEPAAVRGQGRLHIFRVDYIHNYDNYLSAESVLIDTGFGASWDCHINANCPEQEGFEEEQKATCRIILTLEEGMGYCTGTLVNNTSKDETPYVLSAFHCQDGYTPMWDLFRFDFNYQSASCANPATEPTFNSIVGCQYRAGLQGTDFLLMEILSDIPTSFDVYFCGWDRAHSLTVDSVRLFHHPVGDIKKISGANTPTIIHPQPISWNNGVTTAGSNHYRVNFGFGRFEVGSSGASLLDSRGLIRGQLHGGNASCSSNTIGYFGRMTKSWTGGGQDDNRLSNWLDPLDLGVDTLHGLPQEVGDLYLVEGKVETQEAEAITAVEIVVTNNVGAVVATTTVDDLGQFSIELPMGETYTITPSKDINYGNGISTFDIVKIRKYILGIGDLATPFDLLAADVNASGAVSTFDIIKIQKLILLITNDFGSGADVESWLFIPSNYSFMDTTSPFEDDFPKSITIELTENMTNLNFTGVKMGDVNKSANPQN